MDEASTGIPEKMQAMVTMGHGDIDHLVFYPDWPTPKPESDEVLIKVGACGLNNTDVNTRTGWYSKAVSETTAGASYAKVDEDDATSGGAPISFPRIQGADVCGEIIAVGKDVDANCIGERVITDNWLRDPSDPMNMDRTGYFGSERNGGFAQYTTIPARNAIAVKSQLSDAELATFFCSFSAAEGMLARAAVSNTDCVLIPGASGDVGSTLVQLAKLRGACVIALASEAKHTTVEKLGADVVLLRHPADLKQRLQFERVTVVVDIVDGVIWSELIDILQKRWALRLLLGNRRPIGGI